MIYKLKFTRIALKEFNKLDPNIKKELKKHLQKRLLNPKISKYQLKVDLKNYYKIKLRSIGYRLIYQVIEDEVVVLVVKIGRRDKIYK